jgi:hypothetical protein
LLQACSARPKCRHRQRDADGRAESGRVQSVPSAAPRRREASTSRVRRPAGCPGLVDPGGSSDSSCLCSCRGHRMRHSRPGSLRSFEVRVGSDDLSAALFNGSAAIDALAPGRAELESFDGADRCKCAGSEHGGFAAAL